MIIVIIFLYLKREYKDIRDYERNEYTNYINTEHARYYDKIENKNMYIFKNLLNKNVFKTLLHEFNNVDKSCIKRSKVFNLRQGAAIPGKLLPKIFIDFYYSKELNSFLNNLLKLKLEPLPLSHLHACSILVNDQKDDYITWHYDTNYYKGKCFTLLLTLINRDKQRIFPSNNKNCIMLKSEQLCKDTEENSLIVFEGDQIFHKTEKLKENEKRVIFSMLFCEDYSQSNYHRILRRIKDFSFFN